MFTTIRSFGIFAVASAISLNLAACGAAPESGANPGESTAEVSAKGAHFDTFVGIDGKTYFDLVAANGQNVLRSQGYTSASDAKTGIAAVLSAGVELASFDVLEAQDGEYYFNLVAANHEIVGTSETYASKSNATRGANTVRSIVLSTGVQPKTGPAPLDLRFETFTGSDGETYFHLRAANGEIVLASQGYTTRESAEKGIASVEANGVATANYQIIETNAGEYALRLVAANGQVIARSESYVSKSNAERAITRLVEIISGKIPQLT